MRLPSQFGASLKRLGQHLRTKQSVVFLAVAIYGTTFSFLTIARMYALKSNAWDLGNYNQAIYSFSCCGRPFYWTSDILNNPSGGLFGIHFSPIFFLFVPLYLIYPRPETLLVIQSFGIGLAAVPVYWIAEKRLGSKNWGVLFALVYLLNPLMMGLNWFDFHPEAFIPVTILFVIHFFLANQWKKFAVSSVVALTTIESVTFPLALLALYFAYRTFRGPGERKLKHFMPSISLFAASAIWAVVAFQVIAIINPTHNFSSSSNTFFSQLGATSLSDIPRAVFASPWNALKAMSFDLEEKLGFLLVAFGSMGFLSFLSPTSLIPAAAWLGPSLLSNYQGYYEIGVNYPAFILPFLAYSSVEGMRSLRRVVARFPRLTARGRKVLFLVFPLVFLTLSNPVLSLNFDTIPWVHYGFPQTNPHTIAAERLVKLIPPTASILAEDHIFPLISSRINAYTIPWAIDNSTGPFFYYVYELVNKVDYVILDLSNPEPGRTNAVLAMTSGFGVLAYSDRILLLERGYQGNTIEFSPLIEEFNFQQLRLRNGSIVPDESGTDSKVLMNPGNMTAGADFWWGPYVQLPPAIYEISFWMRTGSPCTGNLLTLKISAFDWLVKTVPPDDPAFVSDLTVVTRSTGSKTVFSTTQLDCSMLNPQNYQPVSVTIALDTFGDYEFTGLNVTSKVALFLDRITVTEIRPLSYLQPFPIQLKEGYPIMYGEQKVSSYLAISAMIPPNQPVLLQQSLALVVKHSGATYLTPDNFQVNSSPSLSTLEAMSKNVNYIMIDGSWNATVVNLIMSDQTIRDHFAILSQSLGTILLVRDSGNNLLPVNITESVQVNQYNTKLPADDSSFRLSLLRVIEFLRPRVACAASACMKTTVMQVTDPNITLQLGD